MNAQTKVVVSEPVTSTDEVTTFTFVLNDGTSKSFTDPDDGVGWYMHESDPDSILVDIKVTKGAG